MCVKCRMDGELPSGRTGKISGDTYFASRCLHKRISSVYVCGDTLEV